MRDPRPDLRYDSQEWTTLLTMAETQDDMLAGVLHGFRCAGLRLHRGAKGYVFRPEFDPESSLWKTKQAYDADSKKWLVPYLKDIVGLLNQFNLKAS
jgi:hypothetical protein